MGDLKVQGVMAPAARVGVKSNLPPLPGLSPRRYTDEAFFRAEIDHVFRRSWLPVGHVSEYEQAGSYRMLDLPFAPVFVVRGKDDKIRAFLNSCAHRGSQVVRAESGSARTFSCHYHGWTYDLAGKLISVPLQEGFPGLKLEEHSLPALRCEQWGGFIYINFDPKAPPLLDWLAPLVKRYSAPIEAPLRFIARKSFTVNCNWKLAVEAFRESYHVPTTHPKTFAPAIDGFSTVYEIYANGHNTAFNPYHKAYLAHQAGDHAPLTQETSLAKVPGMDGKDFHEYVVAAHVFPNSFYGFQVGGFPLVIHWPLAVDMTRVDMMFYGMDWGDGPMPAEWEATVAGMDFIMQEDLFNLSSIQKSLLACPDKKLMMSALECSVHDLHTEIDRCIGVDKVPAELRVADVLREYVIQD